MRERVDRRRFLKGATRVAAALAGLSLARGGSAAKPTRREHKRAMKLGTVTYNLARDWDVPTIIEMCAKTGFEGVELRTTHKHDVEPTMSADQRAEVRKRFQDSPVTLWGLGTTCEFHSDDPAVVRRNVETCRDFVQLAQDVGAVGVKVRPNGLMEDKGIPVEKTLEQIGKALRECGGFAADHGVEIWLEVHGRGTSHPPHIRTIMDHCGHPSVGVCWNSNTSDVKNGSVSEYFDLLKNDIKSCHINELWREDYPWSELFALLRKSGYDRFTLAEIPESREPERLMRYYRALWSQLVKQ
ncbi:MAG: sugar phosphate isomerase/epimerase family protein [Armatimonadota bacterium]